MKHIVPLVVALVLLTFSVASCKNHRRTEQSNTKEAFEFLEDVFAIFGSSYDHDNGYSFVYVTGIGNCPHWINGPEIMFIDYGNGVHEYTLIPLEYVDAGENRGFHYQVREMIGKVSHYVGRMCYQPYIFGGIIEFKVDGGEDYCFVDCIEIDRSSYLLDYENASGPVANELIEALQIVPHMDERWPLDAKNLSAYLRINSESCDYPWTLTNWDIATSEDGRIRLFMSSYDTGGMGNVAVDDVCLTQVVTKNGPRVINDPIWVFEHEGEDECPYGNFNHYLDQSVHAMKLGDETIYFIEYVMYDSKPIWADHDDNGVNHYYQYYSVIGAFKYDSDGTFRVADAFKTPKGMTNRIIVGCEREEPRFWFDLKNRKVGVPLVAENNLRFKGRYLIYGWNDSLNCFTFEATK